MQLVDLSHTIRTDMPVFPGSVQVRLEKAADIQTNSYNEIHLHLSAHTGTHIDCGLHFLKDGFDTASALTDRFFGNAMIVDCRNTSAQNFITITDLLPHEVKLQHAEFVLFHTGWSRFWGTDEYNKGFPVPDSETVRYLAGLNLKGVGIDAFSFDPMESNDFSNHKILLSKGLVLIENLTNLDSLPESGFLFCCLPLKIMDGDGSPVRAVGIVTSD